MKASRFVALLGLALPLIATTGSARAESPQYVSVDLGIGPYNPDGNRQVFNQFFADDHGPLLTMSAMFHVYRIPYVGMLGVTVSGAWARYGGQACLDIACTATVDETLRYDLFPLALEATLRADGLEHHLDVPLFFEGGVGAEYARFRESKGGVRESWGGALGLRWHGRVGLYLDVFEPRAARALDEQHGINHSYVYFELRGSQATGVFPVADNFTWLGGLGFTF